MDNSIYEVERDDYAGFIGQLNKEMMDVEQYYENDMTIMKIRSKNTGTHLCTRIISDENEHYYVFNMPTDYERITPKPVMKITLDKKEDVQTPIGGEQKCRKYLKMLVTRQKRLLI